MPAEPKEPKTVPNAFHGEGDADAGVVTESVTAGDDRDVEREDIERSEDEDVARIERNEGIEPGP